MNTNTKAYCKAVKTVFNHMKKDSKLYLRADLLTAHTVCDGYVYIMSQFFILHLRDNDFGIPVIANGKDTEFIDGIVKAQLKTENGWCRIMLPRGNVINDFLELADKHKDDKVRVMYPICPNYYVNVRYLADALKVIPNAVACVDPFRDNPPLLIVNAEDRREFAMIFPIDKNHISS